MTLPDVINAARLVGIYQFTLDTDIGGLLSAVRLVTLVRSHDYWTSVTFFMGQLEMALEFSFANIFMVTICALEWLDSKVIAHNVFARTIIIAEVTRAHGWIKDTMVLLPLVTRFANRVLFVEM